MGGLTVGVVAALLVFLLVLAFFARRNPVYSSWVCATSPDAGHRPC